MKIMNLIHIQKEKETHKNHLQERLGLEINPKAPLFFWPSRLDPVQKGCQLIADLLFSNY